jgi:hypothetical protein
MAALAADLGVGRTWPTNDVTPLMAIRSAIRVGMALLSLMALYAVCYLALSVRGSYEWEGPTRVWRAHWCWRTPADSCTEPYRPTALGWLFYPLARADEKWWHPTERFIMQCL